MTTTDPMPLTSPATGTKPARQHEGTLGRWRHAVQLFISRSQLGPVNNYCPGASR
jgi:hypothetical protein